MLSRRRFLTIAAAAAGAPALATLTAAAPPPPLRVWNGVALGARATIRIAHPDAALADRLIARSTAEIARMETIFSLYRPDSALVRLNRDGVLREPPVELVEVLSLALAVARQSGGAFDPTVQPLFGLYAAHFARPDADPAGPSPERIAAVLERVDYRAVRVEPDHVRLGGNGAAVTLNGIAQGYVTDRVADLLRGEGLDDVLLDLGEVCGSGRRPDGIPWQVGIADPQGGEKPLAGIALSGAPGGLSALATSGGYGTRFDAAGRHHHLLDPKTGRSASRHASVSVLAQRAVIADALSTALSVAPSEAAAAILAYHRPARAYFVSQRGTLWEMPAV